MSTYSPKISILFSVIFTIACSDYRKPIPEPDYHPFVIEPYEYVETKGEKVSYPSLENPTYIEAKPKIVEVGQVTSKRIDSIKQEYIAPIRVNLPVLKVDLDTVPEPDTVAVEISEVIPSFPQRKAAFPVEPTLSSLPFYTLDWGFGSIREMYEDPMGRIWIGTDRDGLLIWDGNGLTQLTRENGLISNFVECIFEDSKGNIWIGGIDGFTKYDGKKFIHFKGEEYQMGSINSICEDLSGNIWIGGGGLFIWDGKQLKIFDEDQGFGNERNLVWSIVRDSLDRMICSFGGGISIWDGTSFTNFFMNSFTRKLFIDRQGNLWIGTWRDGAYVWDQEDFFHVGGPDLGKRTIWNFSQDGQGNIWMASGNYVILGKDSTYTFYRGGREIPSNGFFRSFLVDQYNRVWIGGGAVGEIPVWNSKGISLINQFSGLTLGRISHMEIDSEGRKWFASGKGLGKIENGIRTVYIPKGVAKNFTIRWIDLDQKGDIFCSTNDGLYIFDGEKFIHYSTDNGLSSNNILGTAAIPDGRMILGSRDAGSIIWDGKGFSQVLTEYNGRDSVLNYAFGDELGRIWFSDFRSLMKWKGNEVTRYSQKKDLPEGSISWIIEDGNRNIVLFTSGRLGIEKDIISVWDGKGFYNFYSPGLNLYPSHIQSGREGEIWVISTSGLFRLEFQKEKLLVEPFSSRDGFKGIAYSGISQDSTGNFWIGSNMGLIHSHTQPDTSAPFVHLDRLDPFFEFVDWRLVRHSQQDITKQYKEDWDYPIDEVVFDSIYSFTNLPANPNFPHNINQLTLHWFSNYSSPHKGPI